MVTGQYKFYRVDKLIGLINSFSIKIPLRQGPDRSSLHHYCLLKACWGGNNDDVLWPERQIRRFNHNMYNNDTRYENYKVPSESDISALESVVLKKLDFIQNVIECRMPA